MKNKGFTLIELMVVVAIIGLLAAIALPKFGDASDSAKAANVQGNLANMRTAISMFYAKTNEYPDLVGNHDDLTAVTGTGADGSSVAFTNYYSKSKSPKTPVGTSASAVNVISTGSAASGNPNSITADADGGWAYYTTDGSIRADLTTGAYGQGINWSEE